MCRESSALMQLHRRLNRLKRYGMYAWAKAKPIGTVRPNHGLPQPLIISLTSYPQRFKTLAATLKTLLSQNTAPDATILWIAHEHYAMLPDNVLSLRGKGLEIRRTQDLRSYKKIIPALSEFPSAYIVTADDDMYFHKDWLRQLTVEYSKSPHEILCHRAHKINIDSSGVPLPYLSWDLETADRQASARIFPTSGAGALYPPGCFHSDVTKKEVFMSVAPTTDDIWLYWMSRLAGSVSRCVGGNSLTIWPHARGTPLWQSNVGQGANDKHIREMSKRYGFPLNSVAS
jgi:hypothetical protein